MANVDGPVEKPGADDQPSATADGNTAARVPEPADLVPVPLMGAALGLHPSSTVLSDPAPANDVYQEGEEGDRPAPPRSGTSVKQSATQRLASLIRSLFARS